MWCWCDCCAHCPSITSIVPICHNTCHCLPADWFPHYQTLREDWRNHTLPSPPCHDHASMCPLQMMSVLRWYKHSWRFQNAHDNQAPTPASLQYHSATELVAWILLWCWQHSAFTWAKPKKLLWCFARMQCWTVMNWIQWKSSSWGWERWKNIRNQKFTPVVSQTSVLYLKPLGPGNYGRFTAVPPRHWRKLSIFKVMSWLDGSAYLRQQAQLAILSPCPCLRKLLLGHWSSAFPWSLGSLHIIICFLFHTCVVHTSARINKQCNL